MKRFEPAKYSLAELRFLLEHMGEAPVVALSRPLNGASPDAVREVLNAVFELEQLSEHSGLEWVGVKVLKSRIEKFLEIHTRDKEMHRRGAPRFSSLHTWDARGRPHRFGTGSDSDFVRTYIDNDGNRHELGIDLKGGNQPDFAPPWVKKAADVELPNDLVTDDEKGFVQCPLCGFAQNYDPASPQSRNMARARVGNHLKSYKGIGAEEHRAVYTHVFGE